MSLENFIQHIKESSSNINEKSYKHGDKYLLAPGVYKVVGTFGDEDLETTKTIEIEAPTEVVVDGLGDVYSDVRVFIPGSWVLECSYESLSPIYSKEIKLDKIRQQYLKLAKNAGRQGDKEMADYWNEKAAEIK